MCVNKVKASNAYSFSCSVVKSTRGETECKRENNEVNFNPRKKTYTCTNTHMMDRKSFLTTNRRWEKEKCGRYRITIFLQCVH